jgi:hypothetical protein
MKTKLILLNLALLNLCTFGPGQWSASAQGLPAKGQPAADKGAFATTVDYVLQFYPLWFTYNQFRIADLNRLVGPDRISPIYHVVVAINALRGFHVRRCLMYRLTVCLGQSHIPEGKVERQTHRSFGILISLPQADKSRMNKYFGLADWAGGA